MTSTPSQTTSRQRRTVADRLLAAAPLVLLALFAARLLTYELDAASLWGDEALYAAVTVDTQQSGHWLPLRIADTIYAEKPVGGFLLLRASFALFGVNEIADRIPGVAAGLLAVLVLGAATERWLGRWYGLFAGVLFVVSGRVLAFHGFRSGVFEGPLLLLLTLALVLWIESLRRSNWRWFGGTTLLVALSVLFKNLAGAGLAAPAVAIGELLARTESWWPRLRRLALRVALLVAAGLGAYAAWLEVLEGFGVPAVFYRLVRRDVVMRAGGDLHAGQRDGPGYYVDFIRADFGWALLLLVPLVVGFVLLVRRRDPAEAPRRALLAGAIGWAVGPTIAVSLFGSKLPWYDLAAYPGIALGAACGLSELARRVRPRAGALVAVLGIVVASVCTLRGIDLLWVENSRRTPLQDIGAALDRFPAARFYVQPGLRFRAGRERRYLRPQPYYYLGRLADRSTVGWPPAEGGGACPVIFLVRRAANEIPGDPERWTRYEFPRNLDADGEDYMMLDGCDGRFVRLIGGNAWQLPPVPLEVRRRRAP